MMEEHYIKQKIHRILLKYRHIKSLAVLCEFMHLGESNVCGSALVYEYYSFIFKALSVLDRVKVHRHKRVELSRDSVNKQQAVIPIAI